MQILFQLFGECCVVKIDNITVVSNMVCKQQNKNTSWLDFYQPLCLFADLKAQICHRVQFCFHTLVSCFLNIWKGDQAATNSDPQRSKHIQVEMSVIPQRSAQLIVIHLGFTLPGTP